MQQRKLREEIFKILFENEIIDSDIDYRIEEFLKKNELSNPKKEFFIDYIKNCKANEDKIVEKIKEKLNGWTFERLGVVERTLLKMSFYEIYIKDVGHEIVINETVELAKLYGDLKTKEFINGILADLVEEKK